MLVVGVFQQPAASTVPCQPMQSRRLPVWLFLGLLDWVTIDLILEESHFVALGRRTTCVAQQSPVGTVSYSPASWVAQHISVYAHTDNSGSVGLSRHPLADASSTAPSSPSRRWTRRHGQLWAATAGVHRRARRRGRTAAAAAAAQRRLRAARPVRARRPGFRPALAAVRRFHWGPAV